MLSYEQGSVVLSNEQGSIFPNLKFRVLVAMVPKMATC